MTRENTLRIAREVGLDWLMHNRFYEDHLQRFAELAAAAEREACAKVCEDMSETEANMNKTWRNGCRDSAEAIRAREEST